MVEDYDPEEAQDECRRQKENRRCSTETVGEAGSLQAIRQMKSALPQVVKSPLHGEFLAVLPGRAFQSIRNQSAARPSCILSTAGEFVETIRPKVLVIDDDT